MIDTLIQLLPLPKNPIETGAEKDWAGAEQQLGIQIPDDYKSFINNYGSGKIADFIIVLNPFSQNKYINLLDQINTDKPTTTLGAIKYLKESVGEKEFPYSIYPNKNSLIPWAKTDNGNVFFLKLEDNSDTPTIVVYDGSSPQFEEYSLSITDFLSQILSGKIKSEIFSLEPLTQTKSTYAFTPLQS